MLQSFPIEVLTMVFEQIPDKRDLKSLCEVSRTIYHVAAPVLYGLHEVVVKISEEEGVYDISDDGLIQAGERPQHLLGRVTDLRISQRFLQRKPCHEDLGDYEYFSKPWQRLGPLFLPLMDSIEPGRLRKFAWDVGLCIPLQLLGRQGCITQHQRELEYLHLRTAGECGYNIDEFRKEKAPCLDALECLKGLSWVGLRSKEDLHALGSALWRNKDRLEILEIDLIDWERAEYFWRSSFDHGLSRNLEGPFYSAMLGLQPPLARLYYPAIVQLSLTGVDLLGYPDELAYAFNSESLRSLTLRRCQGWGIFLKSLIGIRSIRSLDIFGELEHEAYLNEGQIMNLTPSEEELAIENDTLLINYLESADGLEDLHLSLSVVAHPTRSVWKAAARHATTLQRSTYHTRLMDQGPRFSHFREEEDAMDMGLPHASCLENRRRGGDEPEPMTVDDDTWFSNEAPNYLAQLNCAFIGLSCYPWDLKQILHPFVDKECLKIIHIRQSEVWSTVGSDSCVAVNRVDTVDAEPEQPTGPHRQEFCKDGMLGWVTWTSHLSGSKFTPTSVVLNYGMRDFADWAFGPDGIASLRLLTYGDFSESGGASDSCFAPRRASFILRRRSSKDHDDNLYHFFFPESERDPELEELLAQHDRSLRACPTP